jgi:hypothetical protein
MARQMDFFRAALAAITRDMARLQKRMEAGTTKRPRLRTLGRMKNAVSASSEWLLVMMVTATEAYLTDVLALCAETDPRLMNQSEQRASYSDILEAIDTVELAAEMRRRWARNWVDDGGPKRWLDRLTRMGARGFSDDLVVMLEKVWGIRHMVIHNGGRATRDFVKRHPELGVSAGDRIHIDQVLFEKYTSSVNSFIRQTDKYIVSRYPDLIA